MNTGQTCTAPNHVFVPAEGQDAVVQAFVKAYDSFYPEGPAKYDSLSRIVSDGHFNRITSVLEKTQGEIVRGGQTISSERFIAPTIVKNVKADDALMKA